MQSIGLLHPVHRSWSLTMQQREVRCWLEKEKVHSREELTVRMLEWSQTAV